MQTFSADQDSPFLKAPEASWIACNDLAFAIPDQFPVSPGHTLVITRRVVASWFDATAREQAALMDLVNEVKRLLDARCSPRPGGYNVGFNSGSVAGQTVPHVHIHVIPRYTGDMADPRGGVRHVIPDKGNYLLPPSTPTVSTPPVSQDILSTGHPDSPLWSALEWRIPNAKTIDVVAAFVQVSGLELIRPAIFAALRNGAHIRILAGDYLYITDPRALEILHGWSILAADQSGDLPSGRFDARLAQIKELPTQPASFHPKSWHIVDSDGSHLVVGSSNLSRTALKDGLEWNLLVSGTDSHVARQDALTGFNHLWKCSSPLSVQLLDSYEKAHSAFRRTQFFPTPRDVEAPLPAPRLWQAKALAALSELRGQQFERALVTVATGMGKTWLAAFDIRAYGRSLGRRPRVLVIAHRSHILAQIERCLNHVLEVEFPKGNTSWFLAAENDLSGNLVLASVQKLARPEGLLQLKIESFDYTLIDEVHHAEAPSYRQVLAQLKTGFVLGLTATPERSDGIHIASVFDDNIAYSAGIDEGIAERVLVPFHYIGIRDTVDFEQIPWRNGRFDFERLEQELLQSPRIIRLRHALEAHPATRTLFFCVSQKHALFTRDWLRGMGCKAAAVFSGRGSDSYARSLAGLQSGALDSLCVVDMFNEGLDIPAVDRVVMLRPTESKVVFLQQLGRGLRAAGGKERLLVIDFVGNHRIFAQRMVHLLSLRCARAGFEALRRWIERGESDLPEGCILDVELEAKDLLRQLLPSGKTAALDGYRALRDELGKRPLMVEVFHSGFLPKTLGEAHGGWFSFLRTEGDLTQDETAAFEHVSGWFTALEKTALNKSYKMVVVRVLLDLNILWEGVQVAELAAACRRFLGNHPVLSRDLQGENHALDHGKASDAEWTDWWRRWPLDRWQQPIEGVRWFTIKEDRFKFNAEVPDRLRQKFEDLAAEIVDYRLAHYARSRRMNGILPAIADSSLLFRCKVSHSNQVPILRLDRSKFPGIPTGSVSVAVPDGSNWEFKFMKVAVNVAHPREASKNELSNLLRDWFGPYAGKPGTNFTVRFELVQEGWRVFPEEIDMRSEDQAQDCDEYGQSYLRVAEGNDESV